MRILAASSLALLLLLSASCGGGSGSGSSSNAPDGPLSGNWQLNLVQNYPAPQTLLSVSGFLVESSSGLTGSVQGPTIISPNGKRDCGGVGPVVGTITGQSVTFSLSPGGTVFDFTGSISSDNTTMSGSYQALGGACFTKPTSGSWSASLIPPLNGTFAGTLSNSEYMTLLTGVSPPAPIAVSGTFAQTENFGASNATLTGTINAVGYPCFQSVSVSGTISGQNVILSVFGYGGTQIGVLGTSSGPAVAASGPDGITLSTVGTNGTLTLGKVSATTSVGPCPPLNGGSGTKVGDTTVVSFSFQ